MPNSGSIEKSPAIGPLMIVMAIMLGVIAGGSTWLYRLRSQELRVFAKELIKQSTNPIKSSLEPGIAALIVRADEWAWSMTLAIASTGAGMLLVVVLGN